MDAYREIVKKNTDYPALLPDNLFDRELIDSYVELMAKSRCCNMLAALYNAPVTMGPYYTSQVSHDMAAGLDGCYWSGRLYGFARLGGGN